MRAALNRMIDLARRHWVVSSLLILAVPNIVTYLILFPGYFQADQQDRIMNILSGNPSAWSSLLWSYFAFPFIYYAPSYACYGLIQIALFCCTVISSVWRLRVCNAVKYGLWIVIIYAFFPTFLLYNQLWASDICFAYALIIITTCCLEIVKTKGKCLSSWKYCLAFALLIIIAYLLRKNALLICLVMGVTALFVTRVKINACKRGNVKKTDVRRTPNGFIPFSNRTKLFVLLIISFIASLSLNEGITHIVGARVSPSQEFLSVPSVQIAAVYHYGGKIPEEANAFFSTIHSPEEWAQSYESYSADKAKIGVELSYDFLEAWIKTGALNPRLYLKAYLDLEYPFWSFGTTSWGDERDYVNGMIIDFADCDNFTLDNKYWQTNQGDSGAYLSQFGGPKSQMWYIPGALYSLVNEWHIPILTDVCNDILFNRGLPFWVCLVGLIVAIVFKKKRRISDFLFVAAPIIAILVSFLLCAPVALMRYAIEMYYALPILIFSIVKLYKKTPQPLS